MDKQKVLAKLIWDLQTFLSVLDSENLSYIAQAQKKSISELLSKLQTPDAPVEDAEYMVMTCPSSSLGNELEDSPGTDAVWSPELISHHQDPSDWMKSGGPAVPPLPPGGLGGDDDTYEEAEPYVASETSASNTERAESESSHYESYGEEEEQEEQQEQQQEAGGGLVKDRGHYIQWSSSQVSLRPAAESRLCGYLWRRKWLGQWSKQLFIIKNDALLCYKFARDLLPQLEFNLHGCQIVYKWKSSAKIQHQLKLVPVGSESLVLGYSSFQQADEWRKVMEEASSAGGVESHSLSSLSRSDLRLSCRSSTVLTDSDEDKPSAYCSLNRDKGFLNVLMNCQWQSLQCQVEDGVLNMFGEEKDEEDGVQRSPQYTVQLRGCEVRGEPDRRRCRISLSLLGDQVAVLEVNSLEEKEKWLKLLQDGAAGGGYHGNKTQENAGGVLSGLQTRRFPTSNAYMDPFSLTRTASSQNLYSNSAAQEALQRGSQDAAHRHSAASRESVTYSNTVLSSSSSRMAPAVQRDVQKLKLVDSPAVQRRTGSETNLPAAVKRNKRTSFRQSLAVCTERAQAGFLNPLLRRTASAKNSLRRAPSALFIEHGKVFQRKKEWETKAAA